MKITLLVASLLLAEADAAPSSYVINGRIVRADDTPLEASLVSFTIQVLSDLNQCLLHEETHTLNMTGSQGIFGLPLGDGANTGAGGLSNAVEAFDNSLGNQTGLTCSTGTTYDPNPGDKRRVRVTFDEGGGPVLVSEDQIIESIPYASYASTLEGKGLSEIIQVNTTTAGLNQTNLETIFDGGATFTELQALLAGTSAQYTGASPSSPVDFNNQVGSNVGTPVAGTDAANKDYVDQNVGGYTIDLSGVSTLAGNGSTLIWDQASGSWTTGTASSTDSTKLPLAGGVMTGDITMSSGAGINLDNGSLLNAGSINMTGQFVSWNGEVTLPSISFVGDTDTGFYYAGGINIAVDGVNRGIFTDTSYTSTVPLRAGGGSAASPEFADTNNTDTGMFFPTPTGGEIAFSNDGTETMRLDGSGNLGLGTTLPSQFVNLKNDQNASSVLLFENLNTGPLAASMFELESDGGSGYVYRTSAAYGVTLSADRLIIADDDAIDFKTGGSTDSRLHIDSSGNVGVGTAAPTSSLHVEGTGPQTLTFNTTDTGQLSSGVIEFRRDSYNVGRRIGSLDFRNTQGRAKIEAWADLADDTATYLRFTTDPTGGTSNEEVMRITSDGNVGIGTISPGYKLDVTGSIASGPKGTSAGDGGAMIYRELTANGTNSVGFRAPDAIAADVLWQLPAADGTSGQVLQTNGSGVLGWASVTGGGGSGDFLADGTVTMTGQFNAIAGSQSAPGISFAGDEDSGIYSPSANALNFALGGVNRLEFNQNVFQSAHNSGPRMTLTNTVNESSPAFTFRGDDDTGLFTPGADTIGFSSGGTERMRIDASGNIGVGITIPTEKLHVLLDTGASSGGAVASFEHNTTTGINTDFNALIRLSGTNGANSQTWSFGTGSNTNFGSPRNFGFRDASSGVTPLVLTHSSGRVGIGTADPQTRLDVSGKILTRPNGTSAGDAGAIEFRELTANGTNSVGFRAPDAIAADVLWQLPAADGTSGQVLQTNGSGVLGWASVTGGGGSGDFLADGTVTMTGNIRTGGNWISNDGDNEGIYILANGNVGIGTISPGQLLHLSSSAPRIQITDTDTGADSLISASSANGSLFLRADDNNEQSNSEIGFDIDGAFQMRLDDQGRLGIGDNTADAHLEISANGGTTGSVLMVSSDDNNDGDLFIVNENGNVGVGTATPATSLEVRGRGRVGPTGTYNTNADFMVSNNTGSYLTIDSSNRQLAIGAGFGGQEVNISSGNGSLNFKSNHAPNGSPNTSGDTNMTILSSGNVGIGTSTPVSLLDVDGNVRIDDMLEVAGTIRLSVSSYNPGALNIGTGPTIPEIALQDSGAIVNQSTGYIVIDGDNDSTDSSFIISKDNSDATAATELFRVQEDGNVAIGTTDPETLMHINGSGAARGLCVTSDDTCSAVPNGGQISAETTLNTGADYAEYFAAEEKLSSGDLVGLNPETGKARAYREGDNLIGIVSTNPGVIGNSDFANRPDSVLVALVGQVPFEESQVTISEGRAYTLDGQLVGYLLVGGDIYINISSSTEDKEQNREIASLKKENKDLKQRLEALEKLVEKLATDQK